MSGECEKCGECPFDCLCYKKPNKIKTAHIKPKNGATKTVDPRQPPKPHSPALKQAIQPQTFPNIVYKTKEEMKEYFPVKKSDSGRNASESGEDDEDEEDVVNNPSHYKGQRFECIDIIEDFALGFNLGNAIKYILRSDKKGRREEDLKKAMWYLQREVENKKNPRVV